jgi:hypothetical protein
LHEQSHGESLLALMIHRFRGQGLYILASGVAIHHRHALPDSAGLPECEDPRTGSTRL